jgi:serine/threonine protein kinase
VFLIQEYVKGGELFDYCVSLDSMKEGEVARLFRQLVRGVSWLHGHGIVHRDLKLENCLLDGNKNLRIIDLGLGAFSDNEQPMSTFCGSPDFAAPELYMRKLYVGPPVTFGPWVSFSTLWQRSMFHSKDLRLL